MSYTPTEWDNGDVITAAKLNKIEQGISEVSNSSGSCGGLEPLIVTAEMSHSGVTVDKTYAEIVAAVEAGRAVYARAGDDTNGWSVLPFSGYQQANDRFDIPGEVYFSMMWARGNGVFTIQSLTIEDNNAIDMGMYTTDNS